MQQGSKLYLCGHKLWGQDLRKISEREGGRGSDKLFQHQTNKLALVLAWIFSHNVQDTATYILVRKPAGTVEKRDRNLFLRFSCGRNQVSAIARYNAGASGGQVWLLFSGREEARRKSLISRDKCRPGSNYLQVIESVCVCARLPNALIEYFETFLREYRFQQKWAWFQKDSYVNRDNFSHDFFKNIKVNWIPRPAFEFIDPVYTLAWLQVMPFFELLWAVESVTGLFLEKCSTQCSYLQNDGGPKNSYESWADENVRFSFSYNHEKPPVGINLDSL